MDMTISYWFGEVNQNLSQVAQLVEWWSQNLNPGPNGPTPRGPSIHESPPLVYELLIPALPTSE